MYSMYITQRLNIHGLVVPLRSCLPQHGAKFILHIVPSRPRRCYRLIATRASPVPPNLLLRYQGILIRPHDSPLPTFAGFAFCGPMQNTSQIIEVHGHNVCHVFYPTVEYLRPCCSFALRFTPAWCEVHIAHCTITSPPMLYTHLPCPRTSYWRTRSGHLDSPHDSPLPPSAGCPTFYSPRDSPLYAFRFAVLCFVRQQNCSECASAPVGWCEAPSHPSPTKFMFHGILGFPVNGFFFPYAW